MPSLPSAQQLLDSANCFGPLNQHQLNLVTVELLRQIIALNSPMTNTSVQALLDSAQCFACLTPFQMALVRTQLLSEILNVGMTLGCVQCSVDSDPVDAPPCDCAVFYRRDNGDMWYWDPDDAEWVITM